MKWQFAVACALGAVEAYTNESFDNKKCFGKKVNLNEEPIKRTLFFVSSINNYPLGEYCKNDVELTHKLFQELSKTFPVEELKLIDITLRMYTNPVLRVDDGLLVSRLEEVTDEKQKQYVRRTAQKSSHEKRLISFIDEKPTKP